MVKKFCALFGVLLVSSAFSPAAFCVSYSYTDVTVPGAGDTLLNGINNAGTVVGAYANDFYIPYGLDAGWSAFVRNGQTFTTLNLPFSGTIGAEAAAINNAGTVVGNYLFEGEKNGVPVTFRHGFVWNGSSFTDIKVPLANYDDTVVSDISDAGVIVGSYAPDFGPGLVEDSYGFRAYPDGMGGYHYESVALSDGDPDTIDNTFLDGRNTAGREVATQREDIDIAGTRYPFDIFGVLLPEGDQVRFPNAIESLLHDVNNNGILVGTGLYESSTMGRYYDKGILVDSAGVLSQNPQFVDVVLPGSACTFGVDQFGLEPNCHKSLQQINDNGVIVGLYDNGDGVYRGFIGTPGVLGDYNGNGVVDAADYVLWRKGGPLQNEGVDPGVVSPADYTYWRAHFGATSGNGSALGASEVPEPSALIFSIGWIGTAFYLGYSRRKR